MVFFPVDEPVAGEVSMKNIFSLDSKLMQGLSLVGDYILLNLLFLLTCLPVFTIGAAKTALLRVMYDLLEDKGNLYKRYFKTFAAEFKTATPLFLLKLAALLLIGWELFVVYNNAIPLRGVLLLGLLLLLLLVGALFSSVPSQIALFSATRREYLKNALYILITQFPRCFVAGAFDLLPLLLILYNPGYFAAVGPVWLLLYFSVTANLCARLFRRPFAEYLESYEQSRTEDGAEGTEDGSRDPF